MSIEAGGVAAAARLLDSAIADALRLGAAVLSADDYCRLAEECLCLAAVAGDLEAAAELVEAGDHYLRCAAGLIAARADDSLTADFLQNGESLGELGRRSAIIRDHDHICAPGAP
jgi:hypothetical protein